MSAATDPKLDSLITDCSFETARRCFRKLCPGGFQRKEEALENPDTERLTGFTQFGELPLDGDALFFAYAETEKDLTGRSARKAQFDAARDLLKARATYDAGIFIFRGPNGAFRLSYITKIYKATKAEFSHFRRYTYFVDPTAAGHHTFRKQIGGCSFESLEAIQEAFSVEAINKDFYKELANWYFWAMKYVHFPTDDLELDKGSTIADTQKVREHDAKNLIRLLTRMLFVWFIKQRGLVPHEIFDAEAVARDYLDDFSADYLDGFDATSTDSRYYKAILQNFFFAALNQERSKREFRKMGAAHRDNMCLMRYKDTFKDPQRFLDAVEAATPFLNGGLFECLDFLHPTEKGPSGGAKKCYEDGFSDRKDNTLIVPNFLFFAPEHKADLRETWGIASKGKEPVQGLIHILNRYNFTIVENSPIEQEVALDPELLGKVFENLLASYNPETQTTARKQTGSFYTPRPIVDYMVDESLKAYLLKPLTEASGMSEDDAKIGLDLLFSYEEKEMDTVFEPEQVDVLIRAIDQCKILDPACGSGAFPMGILQKLVFVLGKLDKDNLKWEERQKSGLKDISNVKERRQREFEIASDFRDNDDDYGRKLYLIENCLYGVDIQSIATQVSKLRFFISLVVDQNIDHDHGDGNFGVRPLPNLETKFVAADTLIAIDKPGAQKELTELTDVKKLQNELQDIRHKIFSVKTTASKQKYKTDDKAKREEIATALKVNGWPADTADRLAQWDPYKQNDSADFFDPEWMFGLKGFDVVIGNPPYLRIQGVNQANPAAAKYYKKQYVSATGSFDLYVVFIERGMQLIVRDGILNYINPDKWVNASFGKGIRSYCIENKCVHRLISFGAHQVFSACTYSSLLWMGKEKRENIEYIGINPDVNSSVQCGEILSALKEDSFTTIPLTSLSTEPWILADGKAGEVILGIQTHKRTVGDVFIKMFQGIASSKDSVYFLRDAKDRGAFYNAYSPELDERIDIEHGLVKPLLLGDQVHRYQPIETYNIVVFPYEISSESSKKPSLMSTSKIQQDFPLGWAYLKRCESILRAREKGRFDNSEWYQFGRKQGISEGGTRKLLAPDISMGGNFSIDLTGSYYTTTTLYGYIKKPSIKESYESLLALLNSSLLWFYLKNTGSVLANGYFRYKPAYLQNFPIPTFIGNAELCLSLLAKLILFAKSTEGSSSVIVTLFESLIDACVMECYFREHMAKRDLLFHDVVAEALQDYNPDASEAEQVNYLETVHQRLIAAQIPERLARIPEASPDFLAVILKEGKE